MANLTFIFAAVRDGHWYWGLGDPDAGAVVVTGLYLLTSILCLLAAKRLRQDLQTQANSTRSEAKFWLVLAGFLLLLGINKQADLQSLLTLYGRDLVRQAGLYESHRRLQVVFIVGVAFVACLVAGTTIWLARRWSWQCRLASLGLALQSVFVVIRAASFHHVDVLLGQRMADLKINLILESIGLVLMLLAAVGRLNTASRGMGSNGAKHF